MSIGVVQRSVAGVAGWFMVALAGLAGAADATFADEDRDFGVEPPAEVRRDRYVGPTPRTVPGGKTVTTLELKALLDGKPKPFLVDVLSGGVHRSLPGAIWMHNGGLGDFDADEEQRFLRTIALFTGGDKARAIVFFCSGAECWFSWNAALRAVRAGYTAVHWYRGGIAAWQAAGFPTARMDAFTW